MTFGYERIRRIATASTPERSISALRLHQFTGTCRRCMSRVNGDQTMMGGRAKLHQARARNVSRNQTNYEVFPGSYRSPSRMMRVSNAS